MKTLFTRKTIGAVKNWIIAHKLASGGLAIVLALLGWWSVNALTSTSGVTRYVVGTVQKGTVVASVSASGQVAAENQLDIKPKVSGDVVWIGVQPGDVVRQGQAILSLDSTDAAQAVTSAERSLAAAELQLERDTAQAPIDYQSAHDALQTAKDNLETEYANAYDSISTAYLDLPTAMTGANNTLYGYDLSGPSSSRQWNVDVLANYFTGDSRAAVDIFKQSAIGDYATAKTAYDAALITYKGLTRSSSHTDVDATIAATVIVTTKVAQALQSELNFLGTVIDTAQTNSQTIPTGVTALQTTTRNYLSTVNGNLSALLAEKKSLDNAKQTVTADTNNLTLLSVGNTASGTSPISLQVSQNSIENQKENLAALRQTLADYTVIAPFPGTIATVNVQKYASAGSGSAVATLITRQKIATLSLNEVDAAKIKLGDKATLTFDAIDGLTLTGAVDEIDAVGAVSQGVVSYTVKIGFDTQDDRVKSGMTANASIITDARQDVLVVPSSAVKTQNGGSYVQVFTPPLAASSGTQGTASPVPPANVPVTVGLSDDTSTEVISGLTEGQQVVVRTVTTTAKPATASAPSLIGGGGGGGRGGGAVRIGG